MYKMKDIEKIFDEEKMLVGRHEVVPEYRAIEIFGDDAVRFAKTFDKTCGIYGIVFYQFHYLTLYGMETAATYVNICCVRNAEAG